MARTLAPSLSAIRGQQVIVENRSGADGTIGAAYVAKSPADGRTVLLVFDSYAVNPLIYRTEFDATKYLAPVALMGVSPLVLVVPISLPAHTLAEFVALAKVRPGKLNYASTGAGSSNQLAAELFKTAADVDLHAIPYRGGAPAITDLLGGQVEAMFVSASSVLSHLRSGRLRALGVTTRDRLEQLPDVPTISETYLSFEARSWIGLLVPSGAAPEAIRRLDADFRAALESPAPAAWMRAQAIQPRPGQPEEFADFIRYEFKRWGPVITRANIRED
jgi:tripartite-type tricarboxylate transporter receptor subunit TctC